MTTSEAVMDRCLGCRSSYRKALGTCADCRYEIYVQHIEATWPCEFCDPYRMDNCNGSRKCRESAAYYESQIKERSTYVCKALVRPWSCPLEDRVVALALAACSKWHWLCRDRAYESSRWYKLPSIVRVNLHENGQKTLVSIAFTMSDETTQHVNNMS